MTDTQAVVELLRTAEQELSSQYSSDDIRAYRIVTSRALTTAPEDFFTPFDTAVQQGIQTVKQSKVQSQRDALQEVLTYVDTLQTSATSKSVVASFIVYALFGFDILDPLIRDKIVHQIHVSENGAVSIVVHGAERPVSSIHFRDRKHLTTVVNRLLKTAQKKQKVNDHLVRAQLSNGSVLEIAQHDQSLSLKLVKTSQKKQQATPAAEHASEGTEPPRKSTRSTKSRKPSQSRKRPAERNTAAPEETAPEAGEWRTDPKTGKRYKVMAGLDSAFLKAAKRSGATDMSLEQLMENVKADPDFDGDDLNKSAETFMAHLRVPPSKKEKVKLQREKKARIEQLKKEKPEEWGLSPDGLY